MVENAHTERAAWPTTAREARLEQERLREHLVAEGRLGDVRFVVGLDAHYAPKRRLVWAAAVALHVPSLELLESVLACAPLTFPYVPGLLSFREAPAMLAALDRLSTKPQLLLVDGQGMAHPRRFGLACHIGVLANTPTVGVAKSRLAGDYVEPSAARGAWSPLQDRGEIVGAVLRTRNRTRPVFVSVGHRVSLATAVDWTLRCAPRFRLPEPIRIADRLSRAHPL